MAIYKLALDDFEEADVAPFKSESSQEIAESYHDEIIADVSPESLTSQLDQVAQNEKKQQLFRVVE
jgi:hypothetical protein